MTNTEQSDNTEQTVISTSVPTRLQSHQDYAEWELTGLRYYVTQPDHQMYNEEFEEVKSVNKTATVCTECNKVGPVMKPTNNTPGFHNHPSGVCRECDVAFMRKIGSKCYTEQQILEQFVSCIQEQSIAMDIMSEADVYPDNLGVDEDGDAYEFEAGDPICFDQLSRDMSYKFIEYYENGIYGVLEKLHDEGYHSYCHRHPEYHDLEDDTDEHVWTGRQV